MTDLFEKDEEELIEEVVDDFEEVEVDAELTEVSGNGLDSRRRLELMLEERRLRDELNDFVDY